MCPFALTHGSRRLNALDLRLFLAINAGPELGGWKLALAQSLATGTVWVLPVVLAALWVRGPIEMRPSIALAMLAAAFALVVAAIASLLWYVPGPFVARLGHVYVDHSVDSSFPGEHVAVIGALAFALLAAPRNGWTGLVLLAVALVVGWARVFLGAQYPFDVLGGFAIALAANLALIPFRRRVAAELTPRVERWYRRTCRRFIAAGYLKR
jgi:undecaprenyl-diphosphatase